jgi:hypothetical protein
LGIRLRAFKQERKRKKCKSGRGQIRELDEGGGMRYERAFERMVWVKVELRQRQ